MKEINKGLSELKKNAQIIKDKKNFKWDSKSTIDDKQTVVLFLGETNRGDYLHFNGYPKNTTPNLDKENLVSFKNTISQGAYTLVSTPMILSRKGVYDNGLFNETSIISAYK
ncbi:sulfatase-like hydrolase/transferase, partial [Escherichia coli]|nr:sulfatase-like hydrolase/transferase [Escherichia coli]